MKTNATTRLLGISALLPLLLCGAAPPTARPLTFEQNEFQARIEVAARTLEDHPRVKGLSPRLRQGMVEFTLGNIFFSLFHELGHAAVTEMGLPVLGREEDAADSFATTTMLQI